MKKTLFILTLFVLTLSVNAQKKISELPVATSVSGTDLFVIVNAGATKQLAGSVILNAVSDTADDVRNYIDNEIDNLEITGSQITDAGIDKIDISPYASTYIVTAGGPQLKTTTSAGDSIVKGAYWSLPAVGTVIEAKACYTGIGVGKMQVKDYGTNTVTATTPTGNIYTLSYIETKIIILSETTYGVEQKIYTYDDYANEYVNVDQSWNQYTFGGSYQGLQIYIMYNSTTIGYKCNYYTIELKPMHSGYSENVF